MNSADPAANNDGIVTQPPAPHRWKNYTILALGVCFVLFHLYTTGLGVLPNIIQRSVHLMFGMTLVFLTIPLPKGKSLGTVVDGLLIAVSLASGIYVIANYDYIMDNPAVSTNFEQVLGMLFIVVLLEAARRTTGYIFPIMVGVSVLYAFFGNLIPGKWGHAGFTVKMAVERLYLGPDGIWGTILGISATLTVMFVILGGVLFLTGAGPTFMNLAQWVTNRSVGGAAKSAVVASALFGTISGSAVANVVSTGIVTIPLMKSRGYSPEFAAATEATASTGGQFMPPIMGIGAFIMAELLGIPYQSIAFAGLIPALLYFVSVFAGVHFEATRLGVDDNRHVSRAGLLQSISVYSLAAFVLPIAVLIYFFMRGYTPQMAALLGTFAALALFFLFDRRNFVTKVKEMAASFDDAARSVASLAVMLACAGIIVSLVGMTGAGVKLAQVIIGLASGQLLMALILTMLVTIILGMGIATVAAYVVAISVLIPAFKDTTIPLLALHFFIFYFAVMGAITPPFCPAVFVGANLAKANWIKAAWISLKLGLPSLILPFMFVYSPSLLGQGSLIEVAHVAISGVVGVIALAMGTIGYSAQAHWLVRVLLVAAASLLINPGLVTDALGLTILGCAYVLHRIVKNRQLGYGTPVR